MRGAGNHAHGKDMVPDLRPPRSCPMLAGGGAGGGVPRFPVGCALVAIHHSPPADHPEMIKLSDAITI